MKTIKDFGELYCLWELGIKNARGDVAKKLMEVSPPMNREQLMELPLAKARFLVVDLETSGMKAAESRIIEVGAVEVDGFKLGRELSTLVNPGESLPRFISALTGIEDWMLPTAPAIEEVLPTLRCMMRGRVLVAHNLKFDLAFLTRAWKEAFDEKIRAPGLCTVKLSRRVYPELDSHNLDSLAANLHIRPEKCGARSRHRALGDARLTARALVKMLRKLEDEGMTSMAELIEFQSKRKR